MSIRDEASILRGSRLRFAKRLTMTNKDVIPISVILRCARKARLEGRMDR